jgi:hypothetical protein
MSKHYRTDNQDVAILQKLNALAEKYGIASHRFCCEIEHDATKYPEGALLYGGRQKRILITDWPSRGPLASFTPEAYNFEAMCKAIGLPYANGKEGVLVSNFATTEAILGELDHAFDNAPPLESHADQVRTSKTKGVNRR